MAEHRVNVNFTEDAYRLIKRRTGEKGCTVSQHLRDCLALYRWFHEQEREGKRILVERGGEVREVVAVVSGSSGDRGGAG